jgi:hypothetical protein
MALLSNPPPPRVMHAPVLSSIPHLAGLADEDLDTPDPATQGFDLPASPRAAATAAAAAGSNGKPPVVYRLPLYLEDWVDQVGRDCTAPVSSTCISIAPFLSHCQHTLCGDILCMLMLMVTPPVPFALSDCHDLTTQPARPC